MRNGLPDLAGPFLELQEAATPEPAYGFLSGALRVASLPPPGFMHLSELRRHDSPRGAFWLGHARAGGIYATLESSSRALLLHAARSLRPVP